MYENCMYINVFLVVYEEVVMQHVTPNFVCWLRHSSTSSHDIQFVAALMWLHYRGLGGQ